MAAATHIPVVQRISSAPVTGYRLQENTDSDARDFGADNEFKPFSEVTKSEVTSVLLAFLFGGALLTGAAAVLGFALEWGAGFLATW
jgi:hypothetical protein